MINPNIDELKILREKIIKLSLMQLEKPYIHGSHGPDSFDCAGMVWYIYNEVLGIDLYELGFGLSTTTMMMTSRFGKIILFDESEDKDLSLINSGDILFFHRQSKNDFIPTINNKYPGHCGIYLGDNSFIHCSGKYKVVSINNFIEDLYWRRLLVGSKNVIDNYHVLKKVIKQ